MSEQQARVIWEEEPSNLAYLRNERWVFEVKALELNDDGEEEEGGPFYSRHEVNADDVKVPDAVCRALRDAGVFSTNEAEKLTLAQLYDWLTDT